jgi:hypothetical protein
MELRGILDSALDVVCPEPCRWYFLLSLCFFPQEILGKSEARVAIQGGDVCGSIGGIGHHD